ncbi:major facilitator superfamily domain-containing protein [Fusarium circinatum]|uniref:Major facilitator superfamily domain-containing protein n=1 Tax=Fusarium circinatum TaxID=48490 RepID=A0A8H5SUR1_FUSCI|nr:major facilitator superfamily domain-containing protein [Fusarium circinatum]
MPESIEATNLAQRALEEHGPLKDVEPNIVGIDGHRFRINYDVPQEVTDRLKALFDQDDVKYEDIPDDLKTYELREEVGPDRNSSSQCTLQRVMQIPSNIIITHVRPSIHLPIWACVWSAVSASTAATDNFGHLITIRCLAGIAEAPLFPRVSFLLSCWYTRGELGLRMATLYSGLVVATAFSGLIAAGVFSNVDQVRGLADWRRLDIIIGSVNLLLALCAVVLLPEFPESDTGSQKWLFTEEELRVAIQRIAIDRIPQESKRSVCWGFKRAVTVPNSSTPFAQ